MFDQALQDLLRASHAPILEALKCSQGMSVAELSRELGMSYMGIKQHCQKMTSLGYLESWRVPREKKSVGRPEILYRLTPKCDPLFPRAGSGLSLAVLRAARELYGDSAPERLLMQYFEDLEIKWRPKLKKGKSLVEKATHLVELRRQEGWFCRCHYSVETGFRIEDHHSPVAGLAAIYPGIHRFELEMLEKLLGTSVTSKEVPMGKGRHLTVFEIPTLGVAGPEETGSSSITGPPPAAEEQGEQAELF